MTPDTGTRVDPETDLRNALANLKRKKAIREAAAAQSGTLSALSARTQGDPYDASGLQVTPIEGDISGHPSLIPTTAPHEVVPVDQGPASPLEQAPLLEVDPAKEFVRLHPSIGRLFSLGETQAHGAIVTRLSPQHLSLHDILTPGVNDLEHRMRLLKNLLEPGDYAKLWRIVELFRQTFISTTPTTETQSSPEGTTMDYEAKSSEGASTTSKSPPRAALHFFGFVVDCPYEETASNTSNVGGDTNFTQKAPTPASDDTTSASDISVPAMPKKIPWTEVHESKLFVHIDSSDGEVTLEKILNLAFQGKGNLDISFAIRLSGRPLEIWLDRAKYYAQEDIEDPIELDFHELGLPPETEAQILQMLQEEKKGLHTRNETPDKPAPIAGDGDPVEAETDVVEGDTPTYSDAHQTSAA